MIRDEVSVLEANIDDMSGEFFGFLMERLLEEGALDVAYTPATMKKSRPGIIVTVIAKPEREEQLAKALLAHSTTLGVRVSKMHRYTLERSFRKVETPYGPIRVKSAGGRDVPEYEDCAAAARQHGVPIDRVFRSALNACAGEGQAF